MLKRLVMTPISLFGFFSPFMIDYANLYNSYLLLLVYFISTLLFLTIFPSISKFLVRPPLYITDVEFNDMDFDEMIFLKSLEKTDAQSVEKINNIQIIQEAHTNLHLNAVYRDTLFTNNDNLSNFSQIAKYRRLINIYIIVVNIFIALFVSCVATYLLTQKISSHRSWFEIMGLIGGNLSTFITMQSLVCKAILNCCGYIKNNYRENYILRISKDIENSIIPSSPPTPTSLAITTNENINQNIFIFARSIYTPMSMTTQND